MADQRKDIRLFERAASQRLQAARFLLENGFTLDATYLAGYTVECSLKALILKWTSRKEHEGAMAQLTEVGALGHDFEYLKGLLKQRKGKRSAKDKEALGKITDSLYQVASWSPDRRYQVGHLDQEEAEEFIKAVQEIHDWCLRA